MQLTFDSSNIVILFEITHVIGWKQSPMRTRENIHSKFTFIDKFIHFCACPNCSQAAIWVYNAICYVFMFNGVK